MIFACAAVAAFTDVWSRKIYNVLTFTVMLIGIALQIGEHGWGGLGNSLLGIVVGLLLLGWLFVFRMMGAGDVKLLMAFGAVGGARYCLDVAVLSLFLGVVLAFFVMIRERKLRVTLERVRLFFYALFRREFAFEFPKPDPSLYVPYGVALGGAAIWLLYANPLAQIGVLPWH